MSTETHWRDSEHNGPLVNLHLKELPLQAASLLELCQVMFVTVFSTHFAFQMAKMQWKGEGQGCCQDQGAVNRNVYVERLLCILGKWLSSFEMEIFGTVDLKFLHSTSW